MIINPSAHRYLTLFAILASLALTGCVLFLSDISLVYPLLIGVIGVWSVYHHTMPNRRYVLPMLWSLFFILGYVLSFASVLIDPETSGIGPMKDTSMFAFTDDSFFPIFWVMVSGMAGMAFAAKFFEIVYGGKRDLVLPDSQVSPAFYRYLRWFSWFWFFSSITVIGFMWIFGIGRTGLPPAAAFPFMLTGILVYTKNMFIPFLGFAVFVAAERTQDYRRIRTAFWMLLIIGVVGAVAFVSRGFFIFMILSALIYMNCYGRNRTLSSRFFFESVLTVLGLLLILVPGIELLRMAMYAGQSVSSINSVDVSEESSLLGAFGKIITLATGRIVGFRELVVITNYHGIDVWSPWRIFTDDTAFSNMLSFDLYGFKQDPSGETAFGYALGLWGMFYLSSSYLIVFLGSAVASSVVLAFEELFLQRGYAKVSLFMAVIIGLWVWGGIDWFLLSRLLITALFCYSLVRYTRLSAFLR